MPKENKTVYPILGLLNHKNMTGYDIKKRIDEEIGFFWDIGFGQIYPTLKYMEKEELVTNRIEASDGRPNRIVYSITDRGREELKKWLMVPAEKEYVKYEILLKTFFGNVVSTSENIKRIEDFKSRNQGNLAMLKGFKENLLEVLDYSDDHMYYLLTVMFGEKVHGAYLEWADEAVAMLKSKEEKRE